MDYRQELRLKSKADAYFQTIPLHQRDQVEEMYQAFKARLMVELKVNGNSHEGVVFGRLNDPRM